MVICEGLMGCGYFEVKIKIGGFLNRHMTRARGFTLRSICLSKLAAIARDCQSIVECEQEAYPSCLGWHV